jgi:hypothetical protein
MTCEELRQRWNERLDGELSQSECVALDAHAFECEACGRYTREMAAVFGGLHVLRVESDERAALATAMASRSESTQADLRRETPDYVRTLRTAERRRWRGAMGLARAAVVLLAVGLALLWSQNGRDAGPLEPALVTNRTRPGEAGAVATEHRATVALVGESEGQYLAVPQKNTQSNVHVFCLFTVVPTQTANDGEPS